MNRTVKINRINLIDFMEALREIHSSGAEYIDIIGLSDKEQDTIMFEVRDEYIKNIDLTDEFLNDLING